MFDVWLAAGSSRSAQTIIQAGERAVQCAAQQIMGTMWLARMPMCRPVQVWQGGAGFPAPTPPASSVLPPSRSYHCLRGSTTRSSRSLARHTYKPHPVVACRATSDSSTVASTSNTSSSMTVSTSLKGDRFDLALAVALAGASFEAYLVPTGAEGFQQHSFNGAETTFTDRTFLCEVYEGVLQLELLSGHDLTAADPLGTSDPYAVISLGGNSVRSSVINANLNPTWNETYWLYVRNNTEDVLKVRMYDRDFLKSDDDLGVAMIPVSAIFADAPPGTQKQIELQLKGLGAGKGRVKLAATFLPFTEDQPAVADVMVADGRAEEWPPDQPPSELADATDPSVPKGPSSPLPPPATATPAATAATLATAVPERLPVAKPAPPTSAREKSLIQAVAEAADAERKLIATTGKGSLSLPVSSGRAPASPSATAGGEVNGLAAAAAAAASAGQNLLAMRDQVMQALSAFNQVNEAANAMDNRKVQGSSTASSGSGSVVSGSSGNSSIGVDDAVVDLAEPSAWRVLAQVVGRGMEHEATAVAYVDHEDSDTQVWLWRNQTAREAIIAFRGTEQVKWKDFVTDLNLVPTSLNPERQDTDANLPLPLRLVKAAMPTNEVMVHSGFLGAYDGVRNQTIQLLDLITGSGDKGSWKVHVTGHSLGGALATLCAYELATRQGPHRGVQQICMYTYGAPRVGNKAFAALFNQAVHDSWRVTNSNDIIPSVPRLLGYAHVKHSVRMTPDGELIVETDNGRDVFGEGKGGAEVIQELISRVQEKEKWEDVYEEIRAREMAILDTLMDGRALEEHMETFYLATLQRCVQQMKKGASFTSFGDSQQRNDNF